MTRAALSLREVAALVRHLPPEAAVFGHGWSVEAHLLADIFAALAGQPHPSDPRVKRAADEKRARLSAGARRAAKRRRALGIAGSVLRRKAAP
ncbi:MAG TPA: hypothetical protein VFL65_00860 [Jatrophihabitans sp.]|nr:hypothetical protein [Jatrophihabitans sp.]